MNKFAEAIHDYNQAIRLDHTNSKALNELAWIYATCRQAEFRDGKAALKAALTACDLSKWKNPAFLDTLAAAHAETGDYGEAVDRESQALAQDNLTESERRKLRSHLALFNQKQPFRDLQ